MADLITHACTALLWRAWRPRAHTPSFVAGSLLPDLLSRVPAIGLTRLHDQLGWGIPDGLIYGFSPLHLPIGMLLSSYVLALLFPAEQRRGVFRAILGGMALHLAVDLLQNHLGAGYAPVLPVLLGAGLDGQRGHRLPRAAAGAGDGARLASAVSRDGQQDRRSPTSAACRAVAAAAWGGGLLGGVGASRVIGKAAVGREIRRIFRLF